jgi:hypothetical protein
VAILLTKSEGDRHAKPWPPQHLNPPQKHPSPQAPSSSTFLAFVLKPEMPIGRWMAQADTWLARPPGLFAAKPVVVDVSSLLLTKSNLSKLIGDLGARGMRVGPPWGRPGLG